MIGTDLRALRRGDESTFRALATAYHSTLLRLAMIYLPDRAAAERCVQETWQTVLRELGSYQGRPSLRTWICRTLVDVARRNAETGGRSSVGDAAPAVSPALFYTTGPYVGHWNFERGEWPRLTEETLSSSELQGVVADTIAGLPVAQRAVVVLRDVEGWRAADVGDVLGIRDDDQRVLLHRARSRVRSAIERHVVPSAPAA